ncbi:MAG TPA: hypothetical protein VKW76_14030 [Candidatus Binatia bacterium]|nr:hypothetical protein [Candidatus Binatia bacterium]
MTCDEVLTARVLGGALDAAAAAHAAACSRCRADAPAAAALHRTLAEHRTAPPPAELRVRTLRAAAPLVAERAIRPRLARALAATLLALPAIVAWDTGVVRTVYAALTAVLPAGLSAYVVGSYGAAITVLVALSYAAVPLLAARQARASWRPAHA